MLPKAITFDQTIVFPISLFLWKLDIQSFPGTPRSGQFKSRKTFKYASKTEPEKAKIADVNRGGRWPLCGRWWWPVATQGPMEVEGS